MIKLIDLLKEQDRKIASLEYYEQFLNTLTSKSDRDFYKSVIDSVRRRENMATDKQYQQLQNLKNGKKSE
jgi:hypothetical protein